MARWIVWLAIDVAFSAISWEVYHWISCDSVKSEGVAVKVHSDYERFIDIARR